LTGGAKVTYLGVLVAGLLPLLGHGLRLRLGEQVDDVEDGDGDSSELEDLDGDLETLSLRGLRARAVSTEGNVVG
jgi:hypothetical protein